MKKLLTIVSIVLVVVISGGVYIYQKKNATSAGTLQWREFTVTRGDIAIAIDATGFVEPLEEVQIFPEIKGEVVKIFVTAGDQVKKGQTLALINASTLLNDLAQAEAGIKQAEITLVNAKIDWERLGRLEKEKIISRQQFEAGETKYLSAVESLKVAKLKKEQILQEIDLTKLSNLNRQKYFPVTAPIDGVVLTVNAKTAYCIDFCRNLLFSETRHNRYRLTGTDFTDIAFINIQYSQKIDQISYGKIREFHLPRTENFFRTHLGVYTNGVVVYKVTAKLKDEMRYLRSGMSVEAKIWMNKRENVLMLPSEAIIERNGRRMVQIMEGNEPLYCIRYMERPIYARST